MPSVSCNDAKQQLFGLLGLNPQRHIKWVRQRVAYNPRKHHSYADFPWASIGIRITWYFIAFLRPTKTQPRRWTCPIILQKPFARNSVIGLPAIRGFPAKRILQASQLTLRWDPTMPTMNLDRIQIFALPTMDPNTSSSPSWRGPTAVIPQGTVPVCHLRAQGIDLRHHTEQQGGTPTGLGTITGVWHGTIIDRAKEMSYGRQPSCRESIELPEFPCRCIWNPILVK